MDLDELIASLGLGPADVDVVPQINFKMFSGLLKAYEDTEGRPRLKGVASSTTRDLHGDTMLESALTDMEQAAANNLTIFLNHSYNVPEDVAGSADTAKMTRRGVDGEGNPNYDLDMDVLINRANPRAVDTWRSIKDGTKLGLSIGAMIPEGGAVRSKKDGTLTIAHVVLLETSIVGIPANPRSWISQAVKAFNSNMVRSATTHNLGAPTLTLDNDHYVIEGTFEGLRIAGVDSVEVGITAEQVVDAETLAFADDLPDVTDAKVRIIEVDTDEPQAQPAPPADDSSQGAGDSGPGDEEDYAAPAPDVSAALVPMISDADRVLIATLEPAVRDSVLNVLKLLESTTRELVATRAALDEAVKAKDAAEEVGMEAVRMAHRVVTKVANTPLARKATVVSARNDFSHLEGLYGADFVRMLNRQPQE